MNVGKKSSAIVPLRMQRLMIVNRWLVALEIGFQQIIILLDRGFDQLLAPFFNQVGHVFRWIGNFIVGWIARVVPDPGLASEQIDHALEIIFDPDRQYRNQRICTEDVV